MFSNSISSVNPFEACFKIFQVEYFIMKEVTVENMMFIFACLKQNNVTL